MFGSFFVAFKKSAINVYAFIYVYHKYLERQGRILPDYVEELRLSLHSFLL